MYLTHASCTISGKGCPTWFVSHFLLGDYCTCVTPYFGGARIPPPTWVRVSLHVEYMSHSTHYGVKGGRILLPTWERVPLHVQYKTVIQPRRGVSRVTKLTNPTFLGPRGLRMMSWFRTRVSSTYLGVSAHLHKTWISAYHPHTHSLTQSAAQNISQ